MSLVNLNKQCIARWFGCELKFYCAVDWKNQESNRFSYRKVVSLFVQLISYHLLSFMRFRFIEQKFVCCATHSNILSHRIAYTSKVSVKHTNQQQHTTRTVNSKTASDRIETIGALTHVYWHDYQLFQFSFLSFLFDICKFPIQSLRSHRKKWFFFQSCGTNTKKYEGIEN